MSFRPTPGEPACTECGTKLNWINDDLSSILCGQCMNMGQEVTILDPDLERLKNERRERVVQSIHYSSLPTYLKEILLSMIELID